MSETTTLPKTFSDKKIFQIGFNKCGTRSLFIYFKKNGIKSVHWDDGKLAYNIAQNAKNSKPLLKGYREKYTFFSDMENVDHNLHIYRTHYKALEQQFPNAKFILNIRDKKKWLQSRLTHGVNGTYIHRDRKNFNNCSPNKMLKIWSEQFDRHITDVKDYFKERPNKLLIFDIEKDPIKKLNNFFSEYKLNSKHYGHIGSTNAHKSKIVSKRYSKNIIDIVIDKTDTLKN